MSFFASGVYGFVYLVFKFNDSWHFSILKWFSKIYMYAYIFFLAHWKFRPPFQIFPQVSLFLGSQNPATVTYEIVSLSLHLQLLCLRCAHGDAKAAVILFPKHYILLGKHPAQISLIATFMLFFLLDFFLALIFPVQQLKIRSTVFFSLYIRKL